MLFNRVTTITPRYALTDYSCRHKISVSRSHVYHEKPSSKVIHTHMAYVARGTTHSSLALYSQYQVVPITCFHAKYVAMKSFYLSSITMHPFIAASHHTLKTNWGSICLTLVSRRVVCTPKILTELFPPCFPIFKILNQHTLPKQCIKVV